MKVLSFLERLTDTIGAWGAEDDFGSVEREALARQAESDGRYHAAREYRTAAAWAREEGR